MSLLATMLRWMVTTTLLLVSFFVYYMFFLDIWPMESSVQLGYVNTTHAKLWIRNTNNKTTVIEYCELSSNDRNRSTLIAAAHDSLASAEAHWRTLFNNAAAVGTAMHTLPSQPFDTQAMSTTTIGPLPSGTCFAYRVLLSSTTKKHGTFCTLHHNNNNNSNSRGVRALFGSCMAKWMWPFNRLRAFEYARRHIQPDVVLLLGDLVYTDIHQYLTALGLRLTASMAWRRTWSDEGVEALLRSTPSLMMHDDHEVENAYNQRGFDSYLQPHEHKDALEWLNRMVKQRQPSTRWYSHRFNNLVDTFMLDTRTYRTSDSLLGREQWHALSEWIIGRSSTAVWRVILSPVVFTGMLVHFDEIDSWSGYPQERQRLLDLIATSNNNNITTIILSGDVHYGAAFHYTTPANLYEFSASAFQGILFPEPEMRPQGTQGEHVDFFSSFQFHFGAFEATAKSFKVQIYSCLFDCSKPKVAYKREIILNNK